MFPWLPTLDTDDRRDPPMSERLALGRGRWHLAQLLASHRSPRQLLHLGRPGFDLTGAFPGARLDGSRTPGIDTVWCDFACTATADPARVVTEMWELVPDDALVGIVDVHASLSDRGDRLLADLGLRVVPGLLAGLRVAFVPIHTTILDHQGGAWQSLVMVGTRRPKH